MRQPLNRERIVATTLALLNAEGPSALSMRRLARALGVTPMALYNHVPSKAALCEALVESVLENTERHLIEEDDWRFAIGGWMHSIRNSFREHPHVMPLLGYGDQMMPIFLRVVDLQLAHLIKAGLSPERAAMHCRMLARITFGYISSELHDQELLYHPGAPSLPKHLERFSEQELPTLRAHRRSFYQDDKGSAFEMLIHYLIAGIAAECRGELPGDPRAAAAASAVADSKLC